MDVIWPFEEYLQRNRSVNLVEKQSKVSRRLVCYTADATLLLGSITSRCSGKWARTDPPTVEIEPTLIATVADNKNGCVADYEEVSLLRN